MRVLIAYDGSPGSEGVLEHLRRRRAGLPPVAEAMVLAVAEAPAPTYDVIPESIVPPTLERLEAMEAIARRATAHTIRRLCRVVRTAASSLKRALPGWSIQTRVVVGCPAPEILAQAKAWRADLIVLGSRGRSCWQRWVLGSVARDVVNAADCDVRIVRGPVSAAGSPVSLVIGIDGSAASRAAVMAVARRVWPQGSVVKLVMVLDARLSTLMETNAIRLIQTPQRHRLLSTITRALDVLRATGLRAELVCQEGDPKRVLIREVQRYGADCLVVGARGVTDLERLMLGSVSMAVAMRSPCTVEVIRPVPRALDITTRRDDGSQQMTESAARERGAGESRQVAGEHGRLAMPINRIKDFLDDQHVPYESIDHEPEYTAQRTAEATHISGRQMAKTVLIKVDGELAMVVVPAASRIDLERLQQEIGAQHIELAREGEFENLFPDSEPGAEPPFGNLYGLPVFVSERLADNAQIAFNAGTHTEVIRMNYEDFERLVKPHLVSLWIAAGGLKVGHE